MQAFNRDAQTLACGPGDTFCSGALKSNYQDVMRSDSCALETYSAEQSHFYDYYMWLPSYANTVKRGNAFLNTAVDANRFAPKQVNQESFLQGRGQVTSNPNCKDGFLRYLPEDRFQNEAARDKKPWDMTLFAQPTLVPRSCASVTELDIQQRMRPIADAYQERYTPLMQEQTSGGRKRYEEGVTLSTKRYVDFAETAARDRYA